MNVDDLVAELATLMPEDEARLYLNLLRGGPTKAGALASATPYSRSKIYRTLDKMVGRGFVQASVQEPTVFTPVPPERLFEIVFCERERAVEDAEAVRHGLLAPLHRLSAASPDPRPGASWHLVQGRMDILDEVRDRFRDAREEVLVYSTHPMVTAPNPVVRRLWETVVERSREGLRVRGVVGPGALEGLGQGPRGAGEVGDNGAAGPAPWHVLDLGAGLGIRLAPDAPPGHFLVFDRTAVVMSLVADPSRRLHVDYDVALVTDADAFVNTQCALFEALWAAAEPMELTAGAPVRSTDEDGR